MSGTTHDHEYVSRLLDRALGLVRLGDGEAVYTGRDMSLTRFANSRIHQNVAEHDAQVRMRIVHEGRTGVATTNRLDDEGLREVVARAEAVCARSARNPEQPPLPEGGASPHATIGWHDRTATADPDLRAAQARAVIATADAAHLEASGAFSTEASTLAAANTRGLRSSESATQSKLVTVLTGPDGASGYAQGSSPDVGTIDGTTLGTEAVDKAMRAAGATDLEPGEYPVLLEEYAVMTILEYLSYIGFSALAVQEGRSFMELGKRVMGENVRIWDDGRDPAGMPSTVDYEGVPKQKVDLVTDGVATGIVHDSTTASRAGLASTGHGLPAPNIFGPLAWNMFMAPGILPRDGLAGALDRGVWVTRFHYVGVVHAKRAILTGMTKDGTFLVEGGKIVRPIRNFRFTQSIPDAFSRITGASSSTRLVTAEYSGISARVPALLIDRFNFTGATAAEGTAAADGPGAAEGAA